MTVSYVGSLSIGGALPGAALALESAIPDLQARLDALASFAPTTGSLSANLALANGILSNIQNAITLGVVLPDISAQLGEIAAAVDLAEGQLSAAAAFLATLDAAGVYLYTFAGDVENFGDEFDAEIGGGLPGGGGGGASNAVVMITKNPATWAALQSILP